MAAGSSLPHSSSCRGLHAGRAWCHWTGWAVAASLEHPPPFPCGIPVRPPSPLHPFGVPCQSLNQGRATLPQGWLGEALLHLGCPGTGGMWDWYSRGRSREARNAAGAEGRGVEGAEKTWGELCLFSATAPWQRRGGHKAKEFALCRFSISEGAAGITGWGQGVPAPSGRAPPALPAPLEDPGCLWIMGWRTIAYGR